MSDSESKLENVFWLGGSPCAGKSSISEILSGRFDLDVYHADEAFENHAHGLDPDLQPALAKWSVSSWEQRWMRPLDDLVQDVIACYREHFALICEDILGSRREQSLLVEGTALLPRQVATILPKRSHAIWIIPTADFQRGHYSKREWVRGVVQQCSNPEVAFNNWMERDARFAEWIEVEAGALNLQLLKVDGEQPIEAIADAVAAHFQLVRVTEGES